MSPPACVGRVGVLSPGIRRIPHLRALLGADHLVFRPGPLRRVDAVVGWGRKPNTVAARRLARRRGVPFLALEDGFLRSVRPGVTGAPPLSIVVDDLGIYYDATSPSRLERWLAEADFEDAERARARALASRLRAAGLSKYNHQPALDLGPRGGPRVLVVDQTAGDQSLRLGLVREPIGRIVEVALAEHPDAEVVVKTHPDVLAGERRGHPIPRDPRVRLVDAPAHPASLLAQVDRVYVATSQLGFEALLFGLPVTCFGVPWYAGWGLTDDRGAVPARRARARTLEELVAAAYLRYARYVDPETGARCEAERVAEHLEAQRRALEASPRTLVCVGFSLWKQGFLPGFLEAPGTRVRFARDAARAARLLEGDGALVAWGTRGDGDVAELAARRGVPLYRMEDGFLRSVGLGSDLYAPASLVLDSRGLYYDPSRPSDLEVLLAEGDFDDAERARARALRERIVRHGLSKYNVGASRRVGPPEGDAREVVLVVGQVEDDASIARGCLDVRENLALLREARAARPEAWIVWKPHPDVVSGNRRGEVPPAEARRLADEEVRDATLADCLAVATEVHTMTSLVGFEALLRGLRVVVYGQPFYAGWGLTEDRHPHARRTRALDLDALCAATLIRYPRYVSRVTGTFTTPEVVLDQLLAERAARPGARGLRDAWIGRQARKGGNLLRAARAHARAHRRGAP